MLSSSPLSVADSADCSLDAHRRQERHATSAKGHLRGGESDTASNAARHVMRIGIAGTVSGASKLNGENALIA
jgi:hypothetical protein